MTEYEREDWSVRDDALRIYRDNPHMTPEQVAEHLGIDPATVKEWISKNGRLRQIHQPQNKHKLRARRMRVLELSANNHDDQYIARTMGLADRVNVQRLRARALEELAEELRDQKAWDRAKAMHIARLMNLLQNWTPKALGSDEDSPKYADLVLKALAQIAQVSGFNTIHVHTTGETADDPEHTTEADIKAVLSSLDVTGGRLNGSAAVIAGELVSAAPQPGSELAGQNGLPPQQNS